VTSADLRFGDDATEPSRCAASPSARASEIVVALDAIAPDQLTPAPAGCGTLA